MCVQRDPSIIKPRKLLVSQSNNSYVTSRQSLLITLSSWLNSTVCTLLSPCHMRQFSKVAMKLPTMAIISTLLFSGSNC